MFRDTVKSGGSAPTASTAGGRSHKVEPPFRVQQHLQEDARRAATLVGTGTGVAFRPAQGKPS